MNRSLAAGIGSLVGLCVVLAGCASAPPLKDEAHWQRLARTDLAAIRETLRVAHPGAIDQENPAFQEWLESGYQEALEQVPRITRYDDFLSIVRLYTTGFLDGHLLYSDNIRDSDKIVVAGWAVAFDGDRFVVTRNVSDWPVPLPQPDSVLVECDGRGPDRLLAEDVAPYKDRRDLPGVRKVLSRFLTVPALMDLRMTRCTFRTPRGDLRTLEQSYRPVDWDDFMRMMAPPRSAPRENSVARLPDGTLWVKVGNFMLRPGEVDAFERFLDALRNAEGVRRIVFDTRGNAGGDSGVGDRIFESATGGLRYDSMELAALPRVQAFWRVSDIAIDALSERVARRTELYGAGSETALWMQRFLDRMKDARDRGDAWLPQSEGAPRLARADLVRRHARLARFEGPIALVTDEHCASACLDFADLVRAVPGSTHLGWTTSADAVYIDVALRRLPSGNNFILPLKVWRNRIRGNNEPLVPDIPLAVSAADDAAVMNGVLEALERYKD